MTDAERDELTYARDALTRRRSAIAKRPGGIELAPVSMPEDLTRVFLAIEALDRALADAKLPYLPAGM